MKQCATCKKEYDENLENCPYCGISEVLQSDSTIRTSSENVQDVENDTNINMATKKIFCKHCGTEIVDGNDYCNHCGRGIVDENEKHCVNCGKILEPKQSFCDSCGQKVATVIIPKPVTNLKSKFSKKKIIISAVAVAVVVGIICVGVKVFPIIFKSYDTYMAEGDYKKAYDKADQDEKELVLKENIAVVISSDIKESLKDSSSFVLRDVWVEEDMKNIVIKEQGNNSYGGAVSGYCWYKWDEEDEEYQCWISVSDFEEEEEYSWDDTDEKIEKLLTNSAKEHMEEIVSEKKLKLDSTVVARINELNKKGIMEKVELLNEVKAIANKNDDESES